MTTCCGVRILKLKSATNRCHVLPCGEAFSNFWLIVDSIYDGQIGVGSVVGSGRQDGFLLVAFVPFNGQFSVRKLEDTVDVRLFPVELIFLTMYSRQLH
jgi:hypothetical protein